MKISLTFYCIDAKYLYIWIKYEYSLVEYKTFSKILALLHLAKTENVN
jgi:hypothetical protein